MKNKLAKLVSILLCVCIMAGTVVLTRVKLSSAVDNPLLYFNDRAWTEEERLPIIDIFGVHYVPATLFHQLPDVRVTTYKNFKNFMIEHGELWISFEPTTDFAAMQDRTRMYIKIHQYYGEYYVPAAEVCRLIKLGYEEITSTVTGETAIRITDGNEKYTFEELLRRKYPDFFEPETTVTESESETEPPTPPPVTSNEESTVTAPPVTTETEPQITDRTIYITIEDSPSSYTPDILDVLSEFGYNATFFVIGENVLEYPQLLARIVGSGSAVGLHTMTHDKSRLTDINAIFEDIEAENELLGRLIKQKSHIWRAPEGSWALDGFDRLSELELNHNGYIVWDYNVEARADADVDTAIEQIIKGIWDFSTPVIRICDDENAADILRGVLEFIADNADVCEVRTIVPAYYEYSVIG